MSLLRRLGLVLVLWLVAGPAWGQEASAPSDRDPVVLQPTAPVLPAEFERVSSPYLDVHGAPETRPVLMHLSRHASASLPRIAEELGVAIGGGIHVVVAPSQDAFVELQPGQPPSWADGTAYPGLGQIYLRRPGIRGGTSKAIEVVLDHELVHILLGRAFAPQRPPRWLQEGVAQVKAGEFGPHTTRSLARGMIGPGLMTLEELTMGFPDDPRRAELAYAQSADFISWLEGEYGPEVVPTLVAEMRQGADVRAAMRQATGAFLEDLDQAWRARLVREHPVWLLAVSSTEVLWGFVALLAVVGLILARRRMRRRMVRLSEHEQMRNELVRALWRRRDPPG